jgi:hypothetical protein
MAPLPDGAIVGAQVNGKNAPHVVLAKVKAQEGGHFFYVWHDPSTKFQAGQMIAPHRLFLICNLYK